MMLLSTLVGNTRASRKPARPNRSRNSCSVRSLPPLVKTSITKSMIFVTLGSLPGGMTFSQISSFAWSGIAALHLRKMRRQSSSPQS